jgi:hypothetical protein
MSARGLRIALLGALVASGWASACAAAPQETTREPLTAQYGIVEGRRTDQGFVRDPTYPPGVFAVPFLNEKQLAVFHPDTVQTGICSRLDEKPFQLNGGNVPHLRYQCDISWVDKNAIFMDSTVVLPTRGERLEWKPLERESADLHRYAAVASPKLLNGQVLVREASFSGEYPPRKEPDVLRGDEIAFGHYKILDRALFIGPSVTLPATFLYRASQTDEVNEPLEWSFLPENASEKTRSTMTAIYEIPNGYMLRIYEERDHEGFGVDEKTQFFAVEDGKWKLLATAERVRLY